MIARVCFYVLWALCIGKHTVDSDRCGNANCDVQSTMTVGGVEFEYCPEINLGLNCSEKIQFAVTVEKYTWANTVCGKLGVEWKYAIDFDDEERFFHLVQVATQQSWIGLRKMNPNTWTDSVWVDGTPYNKTWNRWKDGAGTVDTNCLELATIGWDTKGCMSENQVVCQKVYPCDSPSPLDDNANVTDLGSVESYYYSVAYTCDTGFFIGGNASIPSETIRCKNNVWDDHTPCEYPPCSNPPSDIHANMSVSSVSFNVDTIATYVCHDGYSIGGGLNLDSSENITCLVGGQWSTHVHCKKKSCGAPEEYNGANVTHSGTLYKDVAQYVCHNGFERINNTYMVECLSNTYWSYAPKCEPIDCGLSPVYSNTHIIYENGTRFENTIRYACDPGYEFEPSSGETWESITCQATGNWTTLHSICQRKNCGNPNDDPNAVSVFNGTLYEDIVRYACNYGYILSDLPDMDIQNVSCLRNGTWEYHALCKPVDCGSPPIDANAVISKNNSHLFNDTILYSCNSGYVMNGTNEIKAIIYCTEKGDWSEHNVCVRRSCGAPKADPNAVSVFNGTLYKDIVRYDCNYGYILSDLHDMDIQNVSCLCNGTWEYHALCKPVDCGDPPIDANAVIFNNSHLFNDTLLYSCNSGYVLNGTNEMKAIIYCTEKGDWSEHNVCVRRSCGAPPFDQNANISVKNPLYTFETIATYHCNKGYWMNGTTTDTIACQADGTWEYMSPCSIILCNDPPVDTYANLTQGVTILHNDAIAVYDNVTQGRPFMYNDTVIYSCRQGYFLNGRNVSISCGERGQWYGDDPCVKSTPRSGCSCGVLEDDPNAIPVDPNILNYTCMSVAILQCKNGYHIDGHDENSIYEYVQCLQNGTWSSRSYCISSSSNTWIRAKRVVFKPEEAVGAVAVGSVGLIITITMLTLVCLSDVKMLQSQFKNMMLKNLCLTNKEREIHPYRDKSQECCSKK
ncbi:unnamed protein product [Owenia fusiformis]|uniref:Uncharacterized protein n=1 Tax=Owenia fusiformis TaxID=6347 RepID=A0A8J1TFI0_OWEFU|nr:unnamed protein product [Owenia fusiformis]